MSKQELAESMAEFLEWRTPTPYEFAYDWEGNQKRGSSGSVELVREDWFIRGDREYRLKKAIFKEIKSPDGFFAVWDKLDEMKLDITFDAHNSSGKSGRQTHCHITSHICGDNRIGVKTDPDRYTAFYEAVHEMTNQRSVEGYE